MLGLAAKPFHINYKSLLCSLQLKINAGTYPVYLHGVLMAQVLYYTSHSFHRISLYLIFPVLHQMDTTISVFLMGK